MARKRGLNHWLPASTRRVATGLRRDGPGWLIILILVVILLRIPSLFYPYSYGDQGIYLTLGQAIRQGVVLYREIHDNKPPLLYLLAAISGSLAWFQALLLVWNLGTILIFWRLAQSLFDKQARPVLTATVLFALLTTWPRLEGQVANAEIFMILPIIAGFWLIFGGKKQEKLRFLGAGIFFGLAVLFKVPAGFDFAAALFFLFFLFLSQKKKNYSLLTTHYPLLIFGFLTPILLSSFFFALQKALPYFLQAGFLQNIGYLSSWKGKTHAGLIVSPGFLLRFGSLLLFSFLLFLFNKKLNKNLLLLSLWLIFSFFGATLSGRPYPHYLIQVLPPASFLVGLLLAKIKKLERLIALFFLGLLLVAYQYFDFWQYPTLPYYQNFLAWASRQKTTQEYLLHFNSQLPQNYQLASFLNQNTSPQDRVFIWGEDAPCLYALSRRLPPGRYTANYHIKDFDGYQETLKAIQVVRPKFVVILSRKDRFPQLEEFLAKQYYQLGDIYGAVVYLPRPSR